MLRAVAMGIWMVGVSAWAHSQVSALKATEDHTCVIEDGKAVCWGTSNHLNLSNIPKPVLEIKDQNITDVALGRFHMCVRTEDATAWCLGRNDSGQLGAEIETNENKPVKVAAFEGKVRSITVGDAHSCATLSDNTVQCFGNNDRGQLGNPTAPLSNVSTSAAGFTHTCAIAGNSLHCWGDNSRGQWGHSALDDMFSGVIALFSRVAHTIADLVNPTSISASMFNTCVVLSTGELRCLGDNQHGQLGNPGIPYRFQLDPNTNILEMPPLSDIPMFVMQNDGQELRDIVQVAIGTHHGCARKTNAEIWCWGDNTDGTLTSPTSPEPLLAFLVKLPSGAEAVAVGRKHSCALLRDNTVWCWGENSRGQLGTPPNAKPQPIPQRIEGL